MVILKATSVGVIARDRLDYLRWVQGRSADANVKHFAILNVTDIYQTFDELVITSQAAANPNYVDIYIKLNGAYAKAKKEPRLVS